MDNWNLINVKKPKPGDLDYCCQLYEYDHIQSWLHQRRFTNFADSWSSNRHTRSRNRYQASGWSWGKQSKCCRGGLNACCNSGKCEEADTCATMKKLGYALLLIACVGFCAFAGCFGYVFWKKR